MKILSNNKNKNNKYNNWPIKKNLFNILDYILCILIIAYLTYKFILGVAFLIDKLISIETVLFMNSSSSSTTNTTIIHNDGS